MKDLLEKLDLTEFFAHLCPGAIVLCSFSLWMTPSFKAILGEEIASQQLVAVVLMLIVSYAMGVIVAALSGAGADYYVRHHKTFSKRPAIFWQPTWWCLRFCSQLPVPRPTQSLVEGQMRILEALEKSTGVSGLSILQNPWERLATYRILIANNLGEKGRAILTEAEWVHRRLLFALGVALALLLLSLQAGFRLLLLGLDDWVVQPPLLNPFNLALKWGFLSSWRSSLPPVSLPLLIVIIVLGVVASFGLRMIAGRLWERELLLTCMLIQLDSKNEAITYYTIPVV